MDLDPRLVDLYDGDNPDGPDHDLYRALVQEAGARTVVDLGCGTGLLTVTLAAPGRRVLGVDPSATMLAHARRRPGAELVRWVDGDSSAVQERHVDHVVMTGNVAQHITGSAWGRTLDDVARMLRPGGRVAFEVRNPADRAWQRWAALGRATRPTVHGTLEEWFEVGEPDTRGQVDLRSHTVLASTGEHLVRHDVLVFRDRAQVEADLRGAGLEPEAVWGDWLRTPARGHEQLMVVVARRP